MCGLWRWQGRQAGGESAVVIEEIQEQRDGERQAQDATDGKEQQQQQQQDAKGSAKAQDKANARNGSQAKEEPAHAQQENQQLVAKPSRDAAKEGQQLQQAEEGDAQAKQTPKVHSLAGRLSFVDFSKTPASLKLSLNQATTAAAATARFCVGRRLA